MRDDRWNKTLSLPAIKRALELGWASNHYDNANARKHFYFFLQGAVNVEVHWFKGEPGFTIGNQSTTNVFRAIEWIENASRCRKVSA